MLVVVFLALSMIYSEKKVGILRSYPNSKTCPKAGFLLD